VTHEPWLPDKSFSSSLSPSSTRGKGVLNKTVGSRAARAGSSKSRRVEFCQSVH